MTGASSTPLVAVEFLAACIWVGSMVCLAVVSNTARQVLDENSQVTFFRAVGRRYASVGTGSLLVAIAAGLWLAWPPGSWSAATDAAVAVAGLLLVSTGAGMVQARAMTALRQRLIRTPGDTRTAQALARGRRVANALRALMGVLTLAAVVLAAQIAAN